MDELNFTGLQQAIQSGNIRELGSQIIGSYRKALDSMAGEFGLTTMSQPMAEALMKSLNNMQNKLAQSVKREYAARQANMQQLSDRARQGGSAQGATSHKMAPAGQSGRREHERPVIEMYEE
jgi:type VI protein secretion system component VasK